MSLTGPLHLDTLTAKPSDKKKKKKYFEHFILENGALQLM